MGVGKSQSTPFPLHSDNLTFAGYQRAHCLQDTYSVVTDKPFPFQATRVAALTNLGASSLALHTLTR